MTAAETSTALHASAVRQLWEGPIIDIDVHINGSLAALRPYLDDMWLEFMDERGIGPWVGPGPSRVWSADSGGGADPLGALWGLGRVYPQGAESTVMAQWRPDDGRPAAADLSLLREHVLDHLGLDFAIVNCYMAVDSMRYPDFNIALAQATNDWLIEEWLNKEPRLRASMILPSRFPEAAAKEVERVGSHPGFVQALMPLHCDHPYGNRNWHPLLDALTSHDLVFGLHFGGTPDGASTVTGTPNHYISEYVSEISVFGAQILSMVVEGAFAQFPSLRVSVLEGGFAWLPAMWWRFDKEWKGLRRDVPWVQAPPSEIIREHVRFSIAPVDCDSRPGMESILRWLLSDELLMFATDYPHWHDDDLGLMLGAMSPSAQTKLMADNARAWYRLAAPAAG